MNNINDFGANLFINNENQVHEEAAPAQIVHESLLTLTTTVSVETLSSPTKERVSQPLEILLYLSVLTTECLYLLMRPSLESLEVQSPAL